MSVTDVGGKVAVADGLFASGWSGGYSSSSPLQRAVSGDFAGAGSGLWGNVTGLRNIQNVSTRRAAAGAGIWAAGKLLKAFGLKSPGVTIGKRRLRLWG